MTCPHCSAACSKIGQFIIPAGTSKTVVALFQCRGCKTIQLDKVEKDN